MHEIEDGVTPVTETSITIDTLYEDVKSVIEEEVSSRIGKAITDKEEYFKDKYKPKHRAIKIISVVGIVIALAVSVLTNIHKHATPTDVIDSVTEVYTKVIGE